MPNARKWSPTDPADDPRLQPNYIFTLASGDRPPLDKSLKNPKTSRTNEVEREESLQELGYRVYELKDLPARAIFGEASDPCEVENFLKASESGYDFVRNVWGALPLDPANESELRSHFVNILNSVTSYFHPSPPAGTTREAVDSHGTPMIHDNRIHYTSPGISIKAAGPSFEVSDDVGLSRGLGYTNVTAVLDVRVDKLKGKRMVHCQRLATFNRQIFLQQPNRHFARSLLVTEKVFRLVHQDRSGIYVTPLFDIHKDASLFVQFVVGLTSPKEETLGLDTSVQWKIGETSGKKVSGTITLEETNEKAGTSTTKTYDLDMDDAPFVRPGIRGRGTVGWNAIDPATGERVIIKDAWRTDARESECDFLLAAKGIPGVVEILGYQDNCAQTANYRPPGFKSKEYRNRFKLRSVMKKYGLPIWFFQSRLQLLHAFLDVLIGHRELFERGILHRDISILNILLGPAEASEGHRGALIDLEMAAHVEDCKSVLPADPYTGTRFYQSISVVRCLSISPSPPQDYMDDLESFFYVFCHLFYGFARPGVKKLDDGGVLDHFDLDDLSLVANAKSAFTLSGPDLQYISSYWGDACTVLMEEFHEIIRGIVAEKDTIDAKRGLNAEDRLKAYDTLAKNFDVYFGKVKAAFEKAIACLQKEGLNAEELEPYPHTFAAPHVLSSAPPKSSHIPPTVLPAKVFIPIAPLSPPEPRPLPSPPSKKRPSEDKDDAPRKRVREAVVPDIPSTTLSMAKTNMPVETPYVI